MKFIHFPEDCTIEYDCGCQYTFSKAGTELECDVFCEVFDFQDKNIDYTSEKEYAGDE